MTRITRLPLFLAAVLLPWAATGCSYRFQTSKDSSLKRAGVSSIYIAPLKNDTYKAGVENLLYNELVQSISAGRRVRIVSRPELADAVLRGTVVQASYEASASTDSNALFPALGQKVITMTVATEYQAVVNCLFRLERSGVGVTNDPALLAQIPAGKSNPKLIWSSTFSRVKRFPASNQLGSFGTTAPLINESEFDRALSEMAHEMMLEVNESMFAMF